jgi:carrier-protein-independent halogenase WelO5-like protein
MTRPTLETASLPAVTGRIYPAEYFAITELSRLEAREIVRVMRGEIAGCIFRGVMEPGLCERIAENFWKHPQRRQRGDSVPAHYLGTYHYAKSLQKYLDEAAATRAAVRDVFEGGRNVFDELMNEVRAELARSGVTLRVAQHEGRSAGELVVRSWSGGSRYALAAHEDAGQLRAKNQAGFEIQQLGSIPLAAANMCLQNGEDGGQLVYWNIEPDVVTRRALGLEETGYPYQAECLAGFQRIDLPVHAGDIYFFNSRLIHAVKAQAHADEFRSTISLLMGFKDASTAIYWT